MVMTYKILPQHSNGKKEENNFNLGDSVPSQDFSQAPPEHKSRLLLPYQHSSWQSLTPALWKFQAILPELFRQMAGQLTAITDVRGTNSV